MLLWGTEGVEASVEFINLQTKKSSRRSTGVTERGSSVEIAAMLQCTDTIQVWKFYLVGENSILRLEKNFYNLQNLIEKIRNAWLGEIVIND